MTDRFESEDLYYLSLATVGDTHQFIADMASLFDDVTAVSSNDGTTLTIAERYKCQLTRHGQLAPHESCAEITAILLSCQRQFSHCFVVSLPDGERIHAANVTSQMLATRHNIPESYAAALLAKVGVVDGEIKSMHLKNRQTPSIIPGQQATN